MRGAMPAPFETSFAEALLDADRPIPFGINAHNAAVSARRFAVYRNNVVAGLGKTLKRSFSVVEKNVSEKIFSPLGRGVVEGEPPPAPPPSTFCDDLSPFFP